MVLLLLLLLLLFVYLFICLLSLLCVLLSDLPDKADAPTPAEAFVVASADNPKPPLAAGLSPEEKEKTADAAAAGKPEEEERREEREMAKKDARQKDVLEHLIEYKDVKLHFDALWAEMERRELEATRELTSERSFKSPDGLRQVNARNEKVKSYEELLSLLALALALPLLLLVVVVVVVRLCFIIVNISMTTRSWRRWAAWPRRSCRRCSGIA